MACGEETEVEGGKLGGDIGIAGFADYGVTAADVFERDATEAGLADKDIDGGVAVGA